MSDKQSPDPRIVKLTDVRASYVTVFKAKEFKKGDGKPRFSCAFILDKKLNAADIKKIQAAIAFVVKEDGKGKMPPSDKICLQEGSRKPDTDGYGEENMYVSASNEKKPRVVDGQFNDLDEDSGKPYSGCYVDAVIRIWYQDNDWGKRVNASLRIVQYRRKGEPFGESMGDPEEHLSKIEPEDDDGGVV